MYKRHASKQDLICYTFKVARKIKKYCFTVDFWIFETGKS